MSEERRAAGLAAAARVCRDELLALGERIAAEHQVELLEPPAPGTVMLELETGLGEFCLGEAAVTTCLVRADGTEGWGAVIGLDHAGAVAAALADARGGAEGEVLGETALDREATERELRDRRIGATRVVLG